MAVKPKAATKNKSSIKHSAKHVVRHENTQYIFAAVAVFAIVLLAVGSAVYYRFKYVEANQLRTGDYYSYKIWNPDEIVESKDIAFSFNGVRTDTTNVPGFWELVNGDRYVIADVSFKNKTTKPYELSPIMAMSLSDETGKEYQVTSAPAITRGLGGRVAVGETVRGEVGFTLPVSINKATFTFVPYVSSSAPIRVNFNVE